MALVPVTIDRIMVRRAMRYAMVGGGVNAGLYALYLILTGWLGAAPLLATLLVYVVGIVLTYLGNALWSFERTRPHAAGLPRYVAAYIAGYAVQAGMLVVLIELLSLRHYYSQIVAMAAAAATIFVLLNFWVFASQGGVRRDSSTPSQ